jgi:hypothetical protein
MLTARMTRAQWEVVNAALATMEAEMDDLVADGLATRHEEARLVRVREIVLNLLNESG